MSSPRQVVRTYAAYTTTQGMLWTTRAPGVVDDDIVRTLEDALRQLPPADSELRCRVLLVWLPVR